MISTLLYALSIVVAFQTPRGIVGESAPSLLGVQWIGDASQSPPEILNGEVTYLFFFQAWCPGCHSHGFPTLKALHWQFKDNVQFIPIQTVFEGFGTNTVRRAAESVASFDLHLPVGNDGDRAHPSPLLRRYKGGGTPWTVIIDRKGIVRYNGFRLDPEYGKELLTTLVEEPAYEILPTNRGGQDLIGIKLKPPVFGASSAPLTLYRWWTDSCSYCEASLPALDLLRLRYEKRGLRVVCIYHPKPPSKNVNEQDVLQAAKKRDFHGEVFIDEEWTQLRKWWLSTGDRSATSVSILVDDKGIVRFVHPGPELFPSNDTRFSQQNSDFQLLDAAIDTILGDPETSSETSGDAKQLDQEGNSSEIDQ